MREFSQNASSKRTRRLTRYRMDVMKPPLVWVGGRCYRKNPVKQDADFTYEEEEEEEIVIEEDPYDDEICGMMPDLEKTDGGYKTVLSVPAAYFGFIIGKKGETKKRLESETRTQIKIPKTGHEGDVVILGRDKKGVSSARTRLEVMVDSARQRAPFTHFLSLPIMDSSIQNAFQDFKTDVLRDCDGDRGLDASIFQKPSKLHLTLGTLTLMDEREVSKARELLQQCKQELIQPILKNEPLLVNVEGLEYMNDDPGAVDVLYAKVQCQDGSDRLQMVADRAVDWFFRGGLMQRDYDRIKLHITVMNTLFRKDPSGTGLQQEEGGSRERESFDATNVLQKFGSYNFGSMDLNSLHLSQRHSTGPTGYYSCAASVDLP